MDDKRNYVIYWEFEPQHSKLANFLFIYGDSGPWVQLFKQAMGYLGSELEQSEMYPHRYLVVDRWERKAAWEAFHAAHDAEYRALDDQCKGLFMEGGERKMGAYYA